MRFAYKLTDDKEQHGKLDKIVSLRPKFPFDIGFLFRSGCIFRVFRIFPFRLASAQHRAQQTAQQPHTESDPATPVDRLNYFQVSWVRQLRAK